MVFTILFGLLCRLFGEYFRPRLFGYILRLKLFSVYDAGTGECRFLRHPLNLYCH